jgi:hypothetical protein
LGGPIGGAVGSMVELEGQNVLAEGLERDFEVWASALSFSFTEGDLSTVFNADFSQIVSAVFKFMKPGFRAFSQRGQAEKMHDVVKNTFSDGLMKAMRESAKGSFSKPLSDVAVNEASEPILFAINLSKFLKAYRMVPASALESFKSAHGGLHDIYDLLKNLDAKPGQGLQGTRGILSKFVDVEWMAWLEKNKNILTSLPVDVLKSVLGD